MAQPSAAAARSAQTISRRLIGLPARLAAEGALRGGALVLDLVRPLDQQRLDLEDVHRDVLVVDVLLAVDLADVRDRAAQDVLGADEVSHARGLGVVVEVGGLHVQLIEGHVEGLVVDEVGHPAVDHPGADLLEDEACVDVLVGLVEQPLGEEHDRLLAAVLRPVGLQETVGLDGGDHPLGDPGEVGAGEIGVLGRVGGEVDLAGLLPRATDGGEESEAADENEQSPHGVPPW